MKKQEYACDKCGVESHIFHDDHADVISVVHLMEEDHKKWSPECDLPVENLRVINDV